MSMDLKSRTTVDHYDFKLREVGESVDVYEFEIQNTACNLSTGKIWKKPRLFFVVKAKF